jgi:S-methylmethionine-dependent homocysteine/selenocysteine methylase
VTKIQEPETGGVNMTKVVLLDGGMGQELIHRSKQKPHPLWSAKVMMEEPEIVEDVHREYIDAGARVITLNSYSATPERLEREGQIALFEPLQKKAIEIAKKARASSTAPHAKDVKIAGCLPPLFGSYQPENAPSYEECLDLYRRIAALQAPEVDVFLCETMSSIKEGYAAAVAAIETGKPVWLSYSLEDDDSGCLRSGEPLTDAIDAVKDLAIDAILLNCSIPEAIDGAMDNLCKHFNCVGAYANGFTSIKALKATGTVDVLEARQDLGPDEYAQFAIGWINKGAKIIGGCCEVGPAHITELANQLQAGGYELSGGI